MKRLIIGLLSFALLLGAAIYSLPAKADTTNLIANPSFETANGSDPANWSKNSWGTNDAQFSYETAGHTGGHSAKVSIGSYTSGDAKWYADAVNVTAGQSYLYSDYYKSSATTHVFLAYIDANNNYSYQEIDQAAPSADWIQYNSMFVVPSTARMVSVFHVLSSVGDLTIDDASLTLMTPNQNNPIFNASLETANGNSPANWVASNWGNNSPSYQYVNEGHTGSKSVKIVMNNYVDGDAKWYFEPIKTLQPGKQYRFTVWYKSNVNPHAVAMFQMGDGTYKFFGMPNAMAPAAAATQWQQYSDTFIVPTGAVSVSAFLFINQNGWLQTDDYSLASYTPVGFKRPLLTLTFDDGHEDNATTALPVMKQYGLKSTQCYATTFIEGQPQDIINGVLAFSRAGHEICSHTVTHPFLTSLDPTNLNYELQHSQQYLQKLTGQKVNNFASPYGDYNPAVITAIKQYYTSHRSTDEGYNSKDNFNPYNLRVQNILLTTTAQQVADWVTQAKATNTWLILVYHRVATTDLEAYDTTTTAFKQQIQAIVKSRITVKTTNDALAEVTAQLK